MEEYNPKKETALLIAVRLNRTRMVEDLIALNANIMPEDRMARTVTEILISRDDVETLKFLHIQRGNLLDHDLHNKEFPLTLAISHQSRKCIDYILSLKPKAQSFLIRRKYNCPISAAIRRNDYKTMEQLVTLEEFPYIVNKKIHKSISYIHLAVDKRRPEIVKLLLQNGAMVNLLDNNNNTPVHYVSDIPTLKILIEHKARLDVVNKFDHTPIMTAAKEQRNNIFQYLRLYNLKQQEQQHPVVTVSKPTFHERFGRYYRERIREINEILIAKETLRTDEEELPELSGEMPPLEEIEIPTTYIFCGKPLASVTDPTNNALAQQEANIEATAHSSTIKDGMSRHDETTPILKIRQLKRLQGDKRTNLPSPPGCRFIHTEPLSVNGSEESDMEMEIAFTRNLKFSKFGGEDPTDWDSDN
ncbi:hypothetical protein DAPPUDRAFT_340766 [Daphnia pulex]|uniref:Uncharacterized protein n=1 Tax=Daphnia pulex TaxID=6669 RepID=E9I4Q1_DAPPU|nr:hypothetical protein DAPPUDRAFT_340766 [Daphnia pulex]|eukprot:EFX61028.1 hypothetical protein DAPPUDRAFT_340766 [Daphnia pulex]